MAIVAGALAPAPPAGAIVGPSADGGPLADSMLMVLSRAGPASGFCSAIVVAPDVLLTAAHCVQAGAALKAHYRAEGRPVLLDIAAVERSPLFRPDAIRTRERSIDLALVRLAAPLPAPFRPAPLGDAGPEAVGATLQVAGFGLAKEGQATTGGTLRHAALAVRAPLSAILLWGRAPGGYGGACTGDSGGAVTTPDGRVVGVVAWSSGAGSAQCGTLTQAVWIGPQRRWIEDVVRRWAAR